MADSWVELGVDHPPLVGGWVSYPVTDRPQSLVDDFLVLRVSSSMVLYFTSVSIRMIVSITTLFPS